MAEDIALLDAATLLTVTTMITGLLGLLLLAVWLHEPNVRALAWWGASYLIGGSAVTLWSAQDRLAFVTPEMPNALLFIACGLVWNGARLLHGKAPRPLALFAGAGLWVAAMQFFHFAQDELARVVLASLVIATYTVLTAHELQSDRRKSGRRRLAFAVPLLHGVVFLTPIPLTLLAPPQGAPDSWFALFALETLLYVVGAAFIVVVMTKEKIVLIHKTAAMTDPLTGLFNRRAFFESANAMITRQARTKASVAVLAFDLDHFKSINDRFGHAAGDEALKTFAATASATMRATDVLGRIGGEEFVAIIPGTLAEAAMAAERVRAAYELAGRQIGEHTMNSTVSIGTASAVGMARVEDMLARADAALYRAKENGRNRVECAEEGLPTGTAGAQVEIAPKTPRLTGAAGRAGALALR